MIKYIILFLTTIGCLLVTFTYKYQFDKLKVHLAKNIIIYSAKSLSTSSTQISQNTSTPMLATPNSTPFVEQKQKYNIFFIESNIKRNEFSTKQMCAIESAARNNPNSFVQVYTLNARLNKNASFLVTNYSNIEIIKFNANQTLESSLLEFWTKGEAMKSPYASAHLSDFLRCLD